MESEQQKGHLNKWKQNMSFSRRTGSFFPRNYRDRGNMQQKRGFSHRGTRFNRGGFNGYAPRFPFHGPMSRQAFRGAPPHQPFLTSVRAKGPFVQLDSESREISSDDLEKIVIIKRQKLNNDKSSSVGESKMERIQENGSTVTSQQSSGSTIVISETTKKKRKRRKRKIVEREDEEKEEDDDYVLDLCIRSHDLLSSEEGSTASESEDEDVSKADASPLPAETNINNNSVPDANISRLKAVGRGVFHTGDYRAPGAIDKGRVGVNKVGNDRSVTTNTALSSDDSSSMDDFGQTNCMNNNQSISNNNVNPDGTFKINGKPRLECKIDLKRCSPSLLRRSIKLGFNSQESKISTTLDRKPSDYEVNSSQGPLNIPDSDAGFNQDITRDTSSKEGINPWGHYLIELEGVIKNMSSFLHGGCKNDESQPILPANDLFFYIVKKQGYCLKPRVMSTKQKGKSQQSKSSISTDNADRFEGPEKPLPQEYKSDPISAVKLVIKNLLKELCLCEGRRVYGDCYLRVFEAKLKKSIFNYESLTLEELFIIIDKLKKQIFSSSFTSESDFYGLMDKLSQFLSMNRKPSKIGTERALLAATAAIDLCKVIRLTPEVSCDMVVLIRDQLLGLRLELQRIKDGIPNTFSPSPQALTENRSLEASENEEISTNASSPMTCLVSANDQVGSTGESNTQDSVITSGSIMAEARHDDHRHAFAHSLPCSKSDVQSSETLGFNKTPSSRTEDLGKKGTPHHANHHPSDDAANDSSVLRKSSKERRLEWSKEAESPKPVANSNINSDSPIPKRKRGQDPRILAAARKSSAKVVLSKDDGNSVVHKRGVQEVESVKHLSQAAIRSPVDSNLDATRKPNGINSKEVKTMQAKSPGDHSKPNRSAADTKTNPCQAPINTLANGSNQGVLSKQNRISSQAFQRTPGKGIDIYVGSKSCQGASAETAKSVQDFKTSGNRNSISTGSSSDKSWHAGQPCVNATKKNLSEGSVTKSLSKTKEPHRGGGLSLEGRRDHSSKLPDRPTTSTSSQSQERQSSKTQHQSAKELFSQLCSKIIELTETFNENRQPELFHIFFEYRRTMFSQVDEILNLYKRCIIIKDEASITELLAKLLTVNSSVSKNPYLNLEESDKAPIVSFLEFQSFITDPGNAQLLFNGQIQLGNILTHIAAYGKDH